MDRLSFVVLPEDDGITMGQFLRKRCGLSSRVVVRLKREPEGMTANGVRLRTVDPIYAGQTVSVLLPTDVPRIEGMPMPLDIVYEDDHLLLINKPPFLAVHPSAGKTDITLANAVVDYYGKTDTPRSFRPTNRLDKNTSGLLLAAKHQSAAFALAGRVTKEYRAIVCGKLTGKGTIDAPLRIKDGCTITREVGEGGKPSITHWEALATDGEVTLLRLILETGRTHQIRAHCAWIGHPLVGDTMYGTDTAMPRHALHCCQMTIVHPFYEETLRFSLPLYADMQEFLDLRGLSETE